MSNESNTVVNNNFTNVDADNGVNEGVEVVIQPGFPTGTEKRIPLKKLRPNPKNDRFQPGQAYGGYVMPDTLRVNDLDVWFRSETATKKPGELSDPLYVEEVRVNDKVDHYIVLRGNRRWYLMSKLSADPKTPVGIMEEMERVKCVVFKNLTHGQRSDLIHDKSQKDLEKVEKVALIWRAQDAGMTPTEIYLKHYVDMEGLLPDARGYIATINDIEEFSARKDRIIDWMKGTIGTKYLPAGDMGERVRKACMLGLLKDGGHKFAEGDPKPEFVISQPRMRELKTIKEADRTLGLWTPENGSVKFNAKIEEYYLKDLPKLDPETAKRLGVQGAKREEFVDSDGNRLIKRTQIEIVEMERDRMRSLTVKTALQWAKGEAPVIILELDASALFWETVATCLVESADNLPGELGIFAKAVKTTQSAADVMKFLRDLASGTVDGEIIPQEPDTTPESVTDAVTVQETELSAAA